MLPNRTAHHICDPSVSYIAKVVCNSTVKHLSQLCLKVKTGTNKWITIAEKFETRWQFQWKTYRDQATERLCFTLLQL